MPFLIVTGGDPPEYELLHSYFKLSSFVIGVDGTADLFCQTKLIPDVLIGDFDTASPAYVSVLEKSGVKIIRLKPEKDETDTEAAVNYAISMGAEEIIILGALGKRIDHTIANIMMLVRADMSGAKCRIIDKSTELIVTNKNMQIDGFPGLTVSIMPLTSEVTVNAVGLKYPLKGLKLGWGSSRGISNIMLGNMAELEIIGGYALITKYTGNP